MVLGPVFEELLFRGIPVAAAAARRWALAGHLADGVPFALLHGAQNQWAWQPLLVIGLAGMAFGYARYKTGSTTAAR